jgi:hypothetical protein
MPTTKGGGLAFLRHTIWLIAFLSCATFLVSQSLDPFAPENPSVMGRGGSFTASATGYNSFFSNPAGFAGEGEFTLGSVNMWTFMDDALVGLLIDVATGNTSFTNLSSGSVDPAAVDALVEDFTDVAEWVAAEDPAVMEDILQTASGDSGLTFDSEDDFADFLATAGSDDVVAFLEAVDTAAETTAGSEYGGTFPDTLIDDLVTSIDAAVPSGSLRIGGQAGVGYVGNGIGIGLFANTEASVDGENLLKAVGTAYNTITFVGGLGLSFGPMDVGIAIRPMVFGYSQAAAAPVIGAFFAGQTPDFTSMFTNTVYYGSGLGVDVGALLRVGPFTVGASVRDLLGTRILYRKAPFDEYFQALLEASLPAGSTLTSQEAADAISIPMKINVGLEFHPDLGTLSVAFDPTLSIDLLDVTSAVRSWQAGETVNPEDLLQMVNLGGQIKFLRFFTVQAGYYGGYLSAGVGAKLFMLDINAAVAGDFSFEGPEFVQFTDVGASLEVAIRF